MVEDEIQLKLGVVNVVFGRLMRFLVDFVQKQREKALENNPNIKIAKSATVLCVGGIYCESGMIRIGENTLLNGGCSIAAGNGTIEIGDNVLVGPLTVINTMNHKFERSDVPIREQGVCEKDIVLEDDVWVGAHCTILGGVRIGAHSVIGAHSLVTEDVPPYSVACGVPCRVIKTRRESEQ